MRCSARGPRFIFAIAAATSLCVWLAPAAAAEFSPIELVSKTSKEQAGFARQPAISADGAYVAFYGELGGHTGILRKNLKTGAVTSVVEGAAEFPSISAEGRYVSFTTTQSLESVRDSEPETSDVYVADLETSPPTYELASTVEGHRMAGSSSAAARVALSANGLEVAFVNEGQVYVHARGTESPTLITVKRGADAPEPVPGGGAYENAGAALSADGNVVAWVGENLPDQVPLLAAEEQRIREIEAGSGSEIEKANRYFEPLWRSIPPIGKNDSTAAPTRRIVGGGDPLAPGCGGNAAEAVCQGPFPKLDAVRLRNSLMGWEGVGWGTSLPQLSADGSTVAVIGLPEEDADLFVVDMRPGLSRMEAVHQLTRWTNPVPDESGTGTTINEGALFGHAQNLVYTGPIKQCAISPDGTRIVFTTERQNFSLSPPSLLTAKPVPLPTVVELYQLNLETETLERITPGPGTEVSVAPGEGLEVGEAQAIATAKYGEASLGASGPSYAGDDRTIAFASTAYNMVSGDSNEQSDVFTVESEPSSPIEQSRISPRPSSISVIPSWRLTTHAVSRPNGAVRVIAGVPGVGRLQVRAKSRVGTKPAPRKVISAQKRAAAAETVRIDLRLPHKLRRLARRKGGLYTVLDVQFAGPGGKPLRQQLVARFRVHAKSKPKKARQR